MARIEIAPEVMGDFERILEHLALHDSPNGPARIAGIVAAVDILAHSPLIGRPVGAGLRELVIGRRPNAYLALYRFVAEVDIVVILAVRHSREEAYPSRAEPGGAE